MKPFLLLTTLLISSCAVRNAVYVSNLQGEVVLVLVIKGDSSVISQVFPSEGGGMDEHSVYAQYRCSNSDGDAVVNMRCRAAGIDSEVVKVFRKAEKGRGIFDGVLMQLYNDYAAKADVDPVGYLARLRSDVRGPVSVSE